MIFTTVGRWMAMACLAGGLTCGRSAQADTWQDALRDADDLHEAAEDLHERALRLHDHHAMPVTAALDLAAANLYHGIKRDPCAANVVPLLGRTDEMLHEVSAVMALSCDLHTDRKAIALLKDVRHHFVDTAEHIECLLADHRDPHARPRTRAVPPPSSWPASPYGTYYSTPPAWIGQPSPPAVWGSGYRSPPQVYGGDPRLHDHNRSTGRYGDGHQYPTGRDVYPGRGLPRVKIQ